MPFPMKTFVPTHRLHVALVPRQRREDHTPLAGHLAGIRHYKDDEFLIAKHYDSIVEGLKYVDSSRVRCFLDAAWI
jgi:hypothetical protein